MRRPMALALLTALFASPAEATTIWHDPRTRDGAEFQLALPQFEGGDVSAQVLSLSARRRINADLTFHADFVFSSIGANGERGNALGNPYVGLELGKDDMPWTLEGGVRVPIVGGSPSGDELAALLSGLITDFNYRPGAWVTNAVPVELGFRFRNAGSASTRVTGLLGFEGWIPTGDRNDSENFFVYGAQLWFDAAPVIFNMGAQGRLQFSESGDENEIELSFGVQGEIGKARPGVEVRIPVDDLQDLVDVTVAFYVGAF